MKYKGIKIHKNTKCSTWYTRIRINGKQKYISARTQKECYNKLKYIMNNENKQLIENITLKQWYNEWLELYKIGKVKQSTINDYISTIKNIPHNVWNKELNKIELNEIIKLLNSISAERQKQKVYELLRTLYKRAVDNEKIDKDLMARLEKPQHTRENGIPLTREQEKTLIKECEQDKYGDIYLVALYQGLRKGEVLGITANDIDIINNTLNINKAINRNNKIDTTKNTHSKRIIPMFNKTKEILTKYINLQDRIFKISYNRLDGITKELSNKIKHKFSMKDLRSTFITRCKEENIPEFIIQSWVGHRIGSKVTSQVYTKYNQQDNTKYVDIINNLKFYSNSTQNEKET